MSKVNEDIIRKMLNWRHEIHRHPETGFELEHSSNYVASILESLYLEVYRGIGGTGVVAVLKNGDSKRSIALRADMDAIPIQENTNLPYSSKNNGKMHACGHDGHVAMLLGAVKHLSETKQFDGVVHFIFQPDEENGRGAAAMIKGGLFTRFSIDAIYGLHNMPGFPEGRFITRKGGFMASEDNFAITILGRGGHASQPQAHIDPVVLGAEIILALQTIVSRNVHPMDQVVVSVTEILTDGARNVIPSTVTIKGDCRCFRQEIRELIETRMQAIVHGLCLAYGAEYEFNYSYEFHPTINSDRQTEIAVKAACDVSDDVNPDCHPISGSEDFAYFLRQKPGCFIFLGNGEQSPMLHNSSYDFNDSILEMGANFWISLVEQELYRVSEKQN